MSYLKEQIVEIMSKKNLITTIDNIWPAMGYWRKRVADVYCWQSSVRLPGTHDNMVLGCWQTMTEFVKLAKKYGFSYDCKGQEIDAYEQESSPATPQTCNNEKCDGIITAKEHVGNNMYICPKCGLGNYLPELTDEASALLDKSDEDVAEGRTQIFNNVDDALDVLDKRDKNDD